MLDTRERVWMLRQRYESITLECVERILINGIRQIRIAPAQHTRERFRNDSVVRCRLTQFVKSLYRHRHGRACTGPR